MHVWMVPKNYIGSNDCINFVLQFISSTICYSTAKYYWSFSRHCNNILNLHLFYKSSCNCCKKYYAVWKSPNPIIKFFIKNNLNILIRENSQTIQIFADSSNNISQVSPHQYLESYRLVEEHAKGWSFH